MFFHNLLNGNHNATYSQVVRRYAADSEAKNLIILFQSGEKEFEALNRFLNQKFGG